MPSVPPRPRHLAILSLLVLSTIAACAATEPAASRAGAVAPRTAPEALGAGRALVHAGEWEAAAAALVEATADSGDAGLAARFELARLDYRMGNDAVAADRLAALLESPGRSPTLTSAWLLQGAVQIDLGRHDQALAAFGRYIELGGPAAAYARVEQARLLADTDAEAALATLRVVTDGPAPVHARRLALRLAAPLDEAAGRHERALAGYNELLRLSSWRSDRTFALARLGALQEQMGNLDAAADAFNRLVSQYPAGAEAEAALKSLSGMGRPANQLAAGLVHYRRRSDQAARDLFNAFLRANGSSGPGAATALFYLGALAERRGDTGMAVQNYAEAFDADPAGGLAAEALWERGNVLAEIGRRSEAREAYAQVAQRFPASGRAADAAFRAGYMLYTDGDPRQARAAWSLAANITDDAGAARVAFWAGRTAGETGDSDGARALYATAVRRDPSGYYGLRAAAVLAGEPRAPAVGAARISLTAPNWEQAEQWLASWAGPEDPRLTQAIFAGEEWRAALDLLGSGRRLVGSDAVETMIDARVREPWSLYRMARTLSDAGHVHLAYAAAGRLMAAVPSNVPATAAAIARLAYPAPWADQVQYYAEQYNIDPLLVYSMMRQESAFNPVAGSSAGAYGLTQVMPATAQEIARALGKTPFTFTDLARPVVAIQFGAYYLGTQVHGFGGNIYQALAAYNGGPGNAARWMRATGSGGTDVDRFYEEVDYSETRLYLRTVLQNYAWYRYLYGAATRPALTSGG